MTATSGFSSARWVGGVARHLSKAGGATTPACHADPCPSRAICSMIPLRSSPESLRFPPNHLRKICRIIIVEQFGHRLRATLVHLLNKPPHQRFIVIAGLLPFIG
jgi:hypothetical protein